MKNGVAGAERREAPVLRDMHREVGCRIDDELLES